MINLYSYLITSYPNYLFSFYPEYYEFRKNNQIVDLNLLKVLTN
jgi:hypothetical protein